MYRQIHLNHKWFKPITLKSICLSGINTDEFRKKISFIHNFLYNYFVHNFKAGIEFCYENVCLLKDVWILSILFLETNNLFSNYDLLWQLLIDQHLNYLYVRHTAGWFLAKYALNGSRTLDVLQ